MWRLPRTLIARRDDYFIRGVSLATSRTRSARPSFRSGLRLSSSRRMMRSWQGFERNYPGAGIAEPSAYLATQRRRPSKTCEYSGGERENEIPNIIDRIRLGEQVDTT